MLFIPYLECGVFHFGYFVGRYSQYVLHQTPAIDSRMHGFQEEADDLKQYQIKEIYKTLNDCTVTQQSPAAYVFLIHASVNEFGPIYDSKYKSYTGR
jgi:hypothetical protein